MASRVAKVRMTSIDSETDTLSQDALDIKDELQSVIKRLDQHSAGTFATSGMLAGSPNPGLHVQGLGDIGLPLSARDANALKVISHQAPFSKGSETVIDTSVRKTHEINADQLRICNPAWHVFLDSILKIVIAELGIASNNIKADLYKLLLYDQGAFFDKHKEYVQPVVKVRTFLR